MDAVECAVCLQPYDPKLAVPRVVACGHTFCEPCLSSLNPHPSFNSAVRCPLCSLIIPLPTTISSLPKNLELLRLSNPSLPIPAPKPPKTQITPEFLPLNFPDSFFSRWNPLILPESSVSISIGAVSSRLGPPWCCDQNQRVSFFRIGVSPARFGRFRLSYAARVLNFLFGLGESARSELGLVIDASWRCRRGVCRVLGVWMDVDGVEEVEWGVYLVCERFNEGNFKFLEEREDGLVVGMEICEALMGLHSEKLVCGCLGKSCFGFDEFGHCVFDLHGLLVMARRVREDLKVKNSLDFVGMGAFVSPEVLVSLSNANGASVGRFQGSCDCRADVWSLACMLILLIGGDALLEKESFEDFCSMLFRENDGYFTELLMSRYEIWRTKVNSKIEALIQGTKYEALIPILISSLSYHPENRPQVSDIWHCIRGLLGRTLTRVQACAGVIVAEEDSICCLTLADCPFLSKETDVPSSIQGDKSVSDNVFNEDMTGSKGEYLQPERFVTGLHGSGCKTMTLQGHHDCVTGLAIGGGFLFSSSFDRTVNVWSLQDLSHVQTLRGHEHKVLAILVVDSDETLCISGDYGSGICVWNIGGSIGQEPLKKWYEHNDWRYSGIHSLAFSGTGYLYSGSGDKSIKAWSLQDYTLSCTMTGHKSTVSSLAIADGILYSGSWDGTVRLWWLSDHSPLTTLEADTLGNLSPVLSLSVNDRVLVSSCENGTLNIWKDASHVKSSKIQSGSLFALDMDGKWVFAGGWDKIIDIQELSDNDVQIDIKPTASISCDSIITSLLYWHGRLFVGLSDKEIKVLCAE